MSLLATGNTNPGALDRRIRLDYPTVIRTDDGGQETVWVQAVSLWAQKTFEGGGILVASKAKHYEANLVFRIRARNDVRPGWRLVHGDDLYEIEAITASGRGHLIDLSVRALDQTVHTPVSALFFHDGTPFLLHDDSAFLLHREQDAA